MALSVDERERLFKLLPDYSTLAQTGEFLRVRGLTHSASSWDDMVNKRLRPTVEAGDLVEADLLRLLREGEEFGRQHIFLFDMSDADPNQLMDRDRVRRVLRDLGLEELLEQPRLLDRPRDLTIGDVRWDNAPLGRALVIKAVQERTHTRYLGEEPRGGNRFALLYEAIEERAVDVVRLHESGLVELRIHKQRNSKLYEEPIRNLWDLVDPLIPANAARLHSLGRARQRLWEERSKLGGMLRFSGSGLRNALGTVLSAATGDGNADLSADPAADSLDQFLEHQAYCERINVWFVEKDPAPPSRDIHVKIGGQDNEFAITASATAEDHEYVLGHLHRLNLP